MYASLLHDVGYVFYDLGLETRKDRCAIYELFSWKASDHPVEDFQFLPRRLFEAHTMSGKILMQPRTVSFPPQKTQPLMY